MKIDFAHFRLWLVPFALLFGVIVVGGTRALMALPASVLPGNSCSSSSPCLTWINAGTGAGILTTSARGNGGVGKTSAAGSSTESGSGVVGTDAGHGSHNVGALGISTSGVGVLGTSSNGAGLAATVSGTGVAAQGIETDMIATGSLGAGIVGATGAGKIGAEGDNTSSPTSDAVLADDAGGLSLLIVAVASNGRDVLDLYPPYFPTPNGQFAISGGVLVNGPLSGDITTWSVSNFTFGQGTAEGLESEGTANFTIVGLGDAFGENEFRGNNSASKDVFIVDSSGNVHAHSFTADLLRVRQPTSAGGFVSTYPTQGTQQSITDAGEARLVEGSAQVPLDPAFANAMKGGANYDVFVSPECRTRGLFVSERSPSGFVVREHGGGRSSGMFAYRIVGAPVGSDQHGMEPLSGPWLPHREKTTHVPLRWPHARVGSGGR